MPKSNSNRKKTIIEFSEENYSFLKNNCIENNFKMGPTINRMLDYMRKNPKLTNYILNINKDLENARDILKKYNFDDNIINSIDEKINNKFKFCCDEDLNK